MALNEQERQIAEYGAQNGKTAQEIASAISKYRAEQSAPKKEGYLSRVKETATEGFLSIGESAVRGAELMEQGKPVQGAVRSALGAAGSTVRTIFSPITEALAPVIGAGIEKTGVLKNEGVQQKLASLDAWAKAHPDAAANLTNALELTAVKGATMAKNAAAPVVQRGVQATLDTTKAVTQATAGAVKTATKEMPASIMQRVARIPKQQQAKFQDMAGESVGEYLVKRNIYGNEDEIAQQLAKNFSRSKGTADKELARLTGTYKAPPIKTALQELYQREKRVSSPGAFSRDFKRVSQLVQKYNKDGLDMSEINEVKRLYEMNVRLDFVKQNLPESVARSTNIDNALRTWQFGKAKELGLQNLDEINRETRLAKQLLDALGKEVAGASGNNAMTLTDWIVLSGGDPTAIAGFLAKKGISSKKVQSAIAKKLAPKGKVDVKPKHGKPKPGFKEFIRSTEGRTTPQ